MLIVMLFGAGMILLGAIMFIQPMRFANGIAAFSQKAWFHVFEIVSRLVIGVLFMIFAQHTAFYQLIFGLGALLVGVSIFLIVIGEQRHKSFAMKTVKIGHKFRPIGMIAILAGGSLLYVAIN
jgi:hypothetical protein